MTSLRDILGKLLYKESVQRRTTSASCEASETVHANLVKLEILHKKTSL